MDEREPKFNIHRYLMNKCQNIEHNFEANVHVPEEPFIDETN